MVSGSAIPVLHVRPPCLLPPIAPVVRLALLLVSMLWSLSSPLPHTPPFQANEASFCRNLEPQTCTRWRYGWTGPVGCLSTPCMWAGLGCTRGRGRHHPRRQWEGQPPSLCCPLAFLHPFEWQDCTLVAISGEELDQDLSTLRDELLKTLVSKSMCRCTLLPQTHAPLAHAPNFPLPASTLKNSPCDAHYTPARRPGCAHQVFCKQHRVSAVEGPTKESPRAFGGGLLNTRTRARAVPLCLRLPSQALAHNCVPVVPDDHHHHHCIHSRALSGC